MSEKRTGEIIPPLIMDQIFGDSYHQVSNLITGYKRYRILLWVLDSGVVDILERDGPMETEALIIRFGYRSALATLWIDALIDIGILERFEGLIRNNPALSPYLFSGSPLYQGDSIRSVQEGFWGMGIEILTTEPGLPGKAERKMTPEFLRVVSQHSMRGEIQEISRILSSLGEFKSARRLLDIGGGHGMYAISFCQQNPNLSAVILDQPHITPFTRDMVDRYGLSDRIEVISGDMDLDLPYPGYDLVYASHMMYRQEDLPDLISRIVRVLNEGGLFISNHKFKADWVNPMNDPPAALENEIIRSFHRMVPETEFLGILNSAGLSVVESRKVPANTGFSTLHTALKL
ncbi:MAG TPA: methyltransferase domain-containing protein [Methanospirillum sp.]|nr:methyltransferase domain-containing protein [Methanospirillum sp.]